MHMQVIPIIWPILLCAFLTGVLFAWVWFVALPRLRRTEGTKRRASRVLFRKAPGPSAARKSPIVDADQEAAHRNL
jgi:hypothetical protein